LHRAQVHQGGLKINGTHQLLVYAYNVNKLGESVHIINKTETLVFASMENGLTVNADKITWSCLEIRMQDEVTI